MRPGPNQRCCAAAQRQYRVNRQIDVLGAIVLSRLLRHDHACVRRMVRRGHRSAPVGRVRLDGFTWPRRLAYRMRGGPDVVRQSRQDRERRAADLPSVVSSHVIGAGQQTIFPTPVRQWERATGHRLPALTPAAAQLLQDFKDHCVGQGWEWRAGRQNILALELVIAWLGVEVPVREADLHAVASLGPAYNARRAVAFLKARGRLEADPARAIDHLDRGIARLLDQVPSQFRDDVQAWVDVLANKGVRASRPVSRSTIYTYLRNAMPVLTGWAPTVSALREVDTAAVAVAVQAHSSPGDGGTLVAVRSLSRWSLCTLYRSAGSSARSWPTWTAAGAR